MLKSDENEIRKRIKELLAKTGTTLTDVVDEYNRQHPDTPTTRQNLTNKIARQTIRYSEVIEIAEILDHDVIFQKKK